MTNHTIASPSIVCKLAKDVVITEADGVVRAVSPFYQVDIRDLSPKVSQALLKLMEGLDYESASTEEILDSDGINGLATYYYYLSYLAQHQMLNFAVSSLNDTVPIATLFPISPYFQWRGYTLRTDCAYRMSRFAFLRRFEDGHTYLCSPLAHAHLHVESPIAAMLIYELGEAKTPETIIKSNPTVFEPNIVESMLSLLVIGGFAGSVLDSGELAENHDTTLQQWEFHDLMFHCRSRLGRHNNPTGGSFRFLHQIPPQPAVKEEIGLAVVPLPRPDMEKVQLMDPKLCDVMEMRTSIRTYGSSPITIHQLGEFLYRVARVKETYTWEDKGDFTKRPYPSGGASYEMEFYLTIDACEGVDRGFYWYNPIRHCLVLISPPTSETEALLVDAHRASAWICRPQVLITLSARFQRVSWKYETIAYCTVLKNVGVIYSTMYLVATAMRLAPCGIGLGNSDRFSRIAGTDYLKETSVGEFMIGSGPSQ